MRITINGYTKSGIQVNVEGNEVNSQDPAAVVASYNQTVAELEAKPAVKVVAKVTAKKTSTAKK